MRCDENPFDDLAKATDIVRSMVTRFGMSEQLGQMTYEKQRQGFLGDLHLGDGLSRRSGEATGHEIDCAVHRPIERAYQSALHILTTFKTELKAGAARLLEQETLLAAELPTLDRSRLEANPQPQLANPGDVNAD